MLKDVTWSDERAYRSGTESEPLIFYLNGLTKSTKLDLLLGYFSSSAIQVLSLGFAYFISSGGQVRIIANDILSNEDKNAILLGHSIQYDKNLFDFTNINGLKTRLDEYGKHFFECLAWLFSSNIFEIKIIRPLYKSGISHYKSGIFSDGENQIGFRASCNFTYYGLLENLEELDIYLSWENSRSSKWIKYQNNYFNNIFSGNANFVDYIDIENIRVAIVNEFGGKNINELIIQEKDLLIKKKKSFDNANIRNLLEPIKNTYEQKLYEPKFPNSEGIRDYQKEAYNNWVINEHHGIFAMATGTGKTITALYCILMESQLKNDKNYRALILVPTLTLVAQWEKELLNFNFTSIFKVSSQTNWRKELPDPIFRAALISNSFIVIATYDSFVNSDFQKLLVKMPNDTIFIADEAHHLGRASVKERLPNILMQKKLGLSATPKRYYDPLGSDVLESFFNDREPYTFSFSMEKAISEGILCNYEYYPHIVNLSNEELNDYNEISKKIAVLYHANELDEMNPIVQQLLLKRKNIINKATNKLGMTISILTDLFNVRNTLKYTLVYVPEGFDDNNIDESYLDTDDNIRLIDIYSRSIAEIHESIIVNQIYSGQNDRDEILNQFANGNIHVVTSMKCLDEGIDIPRTEIAIFCSSTGNPRQFIQRRGRVLRKHPNKQNAIIHDLVVVPDILSMDNSSDNYEIEKKLVKKELERVLYFAFLSNNFQYSFNVFKEVCNFFNLNLYTIYEEML